MARGNYWSSSKCAELLRRVAGIERKLVSGTFEEWDDWHERAHQQSPFIHWLTDHGLNKLQNFFCWPKDKMGDIRAYVRNRYITKTHLAVTDLEPGKWHETEERLLHSMFALLVEFVEVESAWHHAMWSEKEEREKLGCPTSIIDELLTGKWRSAKTGVDHYEWAATLAHDDGTPSGQAKAAIEILELYRWWTVTRPNRLDPWHLFEKLSEETIDDNLGIFATPRMRRQAKKAKSKEQRADSKSAYRQSMDEQERLTKQYEQEDEDMMIRLVKVRSALWT